MAAPSPPSCILIATRCGRSGLSSRGLSLQPLPLAGAAAALPPSAGGTGHALRWHRLPLHRLLLPRLLLPCLLQLLKLLLLQLARREQLLDLRLQLAHLAR